MNDNYKNWDIKKGDYQKQHDNPDQYFHGYETKKKFSKASKYLIGIGIVVISLGIIIAAVL